MATVLDQYFAMENTAKQKIAARSFATEGLMALQELQYATLRRDGFASMSGSGVLETKPLTVQKPIRYLFVNADASAGSLRAELLDRDGKPLQGYTAEDCVPVMENSTKLRLQWRGGEDVALLQNQPFRIRFLIDHAHLFAFWLSPSEDGASGGAMAAGYAGKMKMQ